VQVEYDKWNIAANRHALAEALLHPKLWHPDFSYSTSLRKSLPGPDGIRRTAFLVIAKNTWAADMRKIAEMADASVEVSVQKSVWQYHIEKARELCVHTNTDA
jgi:hypothetical protein